jgi:hypothetical protein
VPSGAWFVKHYYSKSWEEFSTDRARRVFNSLGELNEQLNASRERWQGFAFEALCKDPSEGFTAIMAALVRRKLVHTSSRIQSQPSRRRFKELLREFYGIV